MSGRSRVPVGWLAPLSLAAALALGCDEGPLPPSDADLGNPVFTRASLITTGSPESCSPSVRPTLTWQATGRDLVHAAIFKENIVVRGNQIQNPGDAVWRWHTGMGTGREGNVLFADGEVTPGDGIGPDGVSLVAGRPYVWAVWAWSPDGTVVDRSSRELFFVPDSLAPATCAVGTLRVLRGRWADEAGAPITSGVVGQTVYFQACVLGYFVRIDGSLAFGDAARVRTAVTPDERRGPIHEGCTTVFDPSVAVDLDTGANEVSFDSPGPGTSEEPWTFLLEAEVDLVSAGSSGPSLSGVTVDTGDQVVVSIVVDLPRLTVAAPAAQAVR